MADPEFPYTVRVWDNFHYMDEEEAYDQGRYATYDEALDAAKRIVKESVLHHRHDMAEYSMFGDDPGIIGPIPEGQSRFSARDYARALCEAHEKSAETG